MKIEKYTKDKGNKYKVLIDSEEVVLYDDTIVKYNLLLKKELDPTLYIEIIKYNDELSSYFMAIKYITKKLRSEKEIREYLKKHDVNEETIQLTINRLKSAGYLNEEIYLKAYINDQIGLTNNGPKKISKNLLHLGLKETDINEAINSIDINIWHKKLNHYIEKKIKSNHNSSSLKLKMKLRNDLINLGYEREDIEIILNKYDIVDTDILKNEYLKARKVLEKKYSGYDLEMKIKERLYRKGFNISDCKECFNEE